MGFWDWLSSTGVDVSKVLSSGGLVTLLVAFLRGWVLTSGQHKRELEAQVRASDAEVANLKAAHANEITNLTRFHGELREADGQRYSELAESRDYYRDARLEEKTRADRATDQLGESVELTRLAVHAITSMNEAAGG